MWSRFKNSFNMAFPGGKANQNNGPGNQNNGPGNIYINTVFNSLKKSSITSSFNIWLQYSEDDRHSKKLVPVLKSKILKEFPGVKLFPTDENRLFENEDRTLFLDSSSDKSIKIFNDKMPSGVHIIILDSFSSYAAIGMLGEYAFLSRDTLVFIYKEKSENCFSSMRSIPMLKKYEGKIYEYEVFDDVYKRALSFIRKKLEKRISESLESSDLPASDLIFLGFYTLSEASLSDVKGYLSTLLEVNIIELDKAFDSYKKSKKLISVNRKKSTYRLSDEIKDNVKEYNSQLQSGSDQCKILFNKKGN